MTKAWLLSVSHTDISSSLQGVSEKYKWPSTVSDGVCNGWQASQKTCGDSQWN